MLASWKVSTFRQQAYSKRIAASDTKDGIKASLATPLERIA